VSAHYDHLERCAGADDNASGVAAALEVARLLNSAPLARQLVIALWDEEERGLIGSRAFATEARQRADRIALMISFDAIGVRHREPGSQRLPQGFDAMFPAATRELERRGRAGDFIGVLGNLAADGAAASFEKQAQRIGLPTLRISLSPMEALALPDALRSDHASFWLNGYPALLLTDTADFRNPRYHCGGGPDDPNTLDYDFIAEISRATAETILDIAVTADDG
jgi:Zn-dependent M28 family amino/carboxypeptidase